MVQNSTQSDSWIKKSTFLPYLVRVLALIARKGVFKCCNPLIHYPIMLYLFLPFQTLKFVFLHIVSFFFWHLFLRMNWAEQNTTLTCSCDYLFIMQHVNIYFKDLFTNKASEEYTYIACESHLTTLQEIIHTHTHIYKNM